MTADAFAQPHVRSRCLAQRRSNDARVVTVLQDNGHERECQIRILTILFFLIEDTATDCVRRLKRCVDRSIGSEAEPRTFSFWHRQASPRSLCRIPFGPRATASGFVCGAEGPRVTEQARHGVEHVGRKRMPALQVGRERRTIFC